MLSPALTGGPIGSESHYGIVPNVSKIAVLRANALGDFIFALPALEALRAAYPAASITLLGKDWHRDFLANRASPVDHVVVVPACPGVGAEPDDEPDADGLARFSAAMQRERFDLAIQIHGGGANSNRLLKRLGAKLTAGLKAPDAPPLDRWIPYDYFQREVLRYLEVVSLVGATPVTVVPRIAVTRADCEEAWRVLPASDAPLAVLHPGSSSVDRRWPPEKFASVGDALDAAGAHVVVTGVPNEHHLVRRLVECMQAPAEDLCGRLSLGGLAGILSRSRVVIANDTGPLHLAAAVGAPTVGIFWGINLVTAGPMTQARNRCAVSWRLHCPLCGRGQLSDPCRHEVSYVEDVPTEEVAELALDLFSA